MQKIKFDSNDIRYITLFESLTHAKVKDCFEDMQETIVFVVQQGDIVKAVGKQGETAKKLRDLLKKKVKIIEAHDDPVRFIKSLILPLKVDAVELQGQTIYLKSNDVRTKGLLIGKAAANLRNYEKTVQRYFPIKELKVTGLDS
ncbi:MAG: NusA-like transcription termination signal-binding factor [Candidatus Woesearchaeota archaeon]